MAHVERGQDAGHEDLGDLRRRLLEARDRRASLIAWRSQAMPAETGGGERATEGEGGDDAPPRRAEALAGAPGQRVEGEGGTIVFVSLNLPGIEKQRPGADALFERGLDALRDRLPGVKLEQEGCDALGRWALLAASGGAEEVKRRCVTIEEGAPANRLLDLDVYAPGGRQVGRAQFGLPPRPCLVCRQPATDCMRLARHSPGDLEAAVRRLLT